MIYPVAYTISETGTSTWKYACLGSRDIWCMKFESEAMLWKSMTKNCDWKGY